MTLVTITDSVILPYLPGYLLLALRVQEGQPSKSLVKRSHAMLVPATRRRGRGAPQFVVLYHHAASTAAVICHSCALTLSYEREMKEAET